MGKPKASMQDIADALGISRATVSNALGGKGRLSEETARLIHAKAAELNFSPSGLGRALRTGRSQQIGLVLPDFRMPLFAEFARAFALAAKARDMTLTVADSLADLEMQRSHLLDLAARGLDGVVLIPMRGSRLEGLELSKPLIVVDAESNPLNSVSADHRKGGQLLAEHLVDLGHRKVLLLHATGPADGSMVSRVNDLRLLGMQETFAARGVRLHEVNLPARFEAARDFIADWQPDGETAIAATYDALAVGAIMALGPGGIRIPEEISVAGFDDTVWSRIVTPPLTTIHQDLHFVAETALSHALGGRGMPVLAPVTLLARGSTAAPAASASTPPAPPADRT